MDPLTACLLASFFIMKIFKIMKVDGQYARQGIVPPSRGLVERWLEGRKARGQARADAQVKPYGSWAYFKQRWFAMWEDLGEEHRRQREADRKARDEARERGLPVPKGTSWRDRVLKAWRWRIPLIGDVRVHKVRREPVDDPVPGKLADFMPVPPVVTPPPGGLLIACEDCGQTLTAKGEHPSSSGCPTKPAPVPESTSPLDIPVAEPAAGGPPSTITEGDDMTTTQLSGEVTGIPSAIRYAQQMAEAHASHGGNEGYLTSLANMEVGPGDIAKVQAAMEASANAGAMWQAAADSIDKNNRAVAEAYSTSPDAANKQANTNE
jgi:hypothetical protein